MARRVGRRGGHFLLFAVGKFLIGLYIGRPGVASSYGAAGALVVLLVWVYPCMALLLAPWRPVPPKCLRLSRSSKQAGYDDHKFGDVERLG